MSNFQKYIDAEKAAIVARESASIREKLQILKNDFRNGTPGVGIDLADLMFRAMDNDVRRAELRQEAGAKYAKDVQAEAETVGGKYKLLTVAGSRGKGRAKVPCTFYVSGFSFADGPGMRYKTVSFTTDRAKAQRFSTSAAVTLLDQLARNYTKVAAVPSND